MKLSEFIEIRLGEELISEVYFGGVKIWPECEPLFINKDDKFIEFDGTYLTDCYIDGDSYLKSITTTSETNKVPAILLTNTNIKEINLTASSLNELRLINLPNLESVNIIDTVAPTTLSYVIFSLCPKLKYIYPFEFNSSYKSTVNMFNGCSSLTSIHLFNTSNVTDMRWMFRGCTSLTTVPLFNLYSAGDISQMFQNCTSLTTVPQFDTSSVSNMAGLFQNCTSLTIIPQFNMSNVTDIKTMFWDCKSLTEIPLLNLGKIEYINNTFRNCTSLTTIDGFTDLGKGFTYPATLDLSYSNLLTRQSCINIFNNLYSQSTYTHTIKLSTHTKSRLSSDDIAIATNKGWIVQ